MRRFGESYSDFLFAQPRALFGVARLFDAASTFDTYNESPSPAVADAWALFTDWRQVGQDLSTAIVAALVEALETQAHEHGAADVESFLATELGQKLVHELEAIPGC